VFVLTFAWLVMFLRRCFLVDEGHYNFLIFFNFFWKVLDFDCNLLLSAFITKNWGCPSHCCSKIASFHSCTIIAVSRTIFIGFSFICFVIIGFFVG
jgi:hypothetical protein